MQTARKYYGAEILSESANTSSVRAWIPTSRSRSCRRWAAGQYGPVFEVRTYILKPDGLPTTIELWRKWVPGRTKLSPLLAAMHSITGTVTRFMHIWPYANLEERARLRAKAVADKVWPPPGGPDHLTAMQSEIYLPADFSSMR